MLEQFSDTARRVVTLAEEEADRMGHPHTGTEHLLLGLLEQEGARAAELLTAAGATVVAAREKVLEAVGPSGPAPAPGPLVRTARAQRALDRAARFSRARGGQTVGTEDILAGVLDVEGRAGQVLRGLGVDVAALGAAVKRDRNPPPPPPEPAKGPDRSRRRSAAPAPHCPHCQVDLAAGLSYRLIGGSGAALPERGFVVAFCPACGAVLGAAPDRYAAPD